MLDLEAKELKRAYMHKYHLEVIKPKRHSKPKIIKNCIFCNREFIARNSMQKYCKDTICKREHNLRRQIWTRGWRERSTEHLNRYYKEKYCNNREKILAEVKAYSQTEKGKQVSNESAKKYYWKNRIKILERVKSPEVRKERREYYRIWVQKNPLQARQRSHKRRKYCEDLTLKTIQLVYENNIKQYGRLTCILCYKPIEFGQDSLEHKQPLSKNGTNNYDNLAIAHRSCNSRKGAKTLEEWRKVCLLRK